MSTSRNTKLIVQEVCNTLAAMAKTHQSLVEHDQRRVGLRLKALYLAKDWEQKAFAAMIGGGMTPQKLGNYEAGRNMLPIDVAIRINSLVAGADLPFFYRGDMSRLDPGFAAEVAVKLAELESTPPKPVAKRA